MTEQLSKIEFLKEAGNAKSLSVGEGNPDPKFRSGIYINLANGLRHKTFFIGMDVENKRMIYERVA